MRKVLTPARFLVVLVAGATSACGSTGSAANSSEEQLTSIVVTTNVLGDMVTAALGDLVGTEVDVEVIMPIGADPHNFAPSARQAEKMENADLLVVNGFGFEQQMIDIFDNVGDQGTVIVAVAGEIDAQPGDDPHVWMDPERMAQAFTGFAETVAAVSGLDPTSVHTNVDSYVGELRALDASISASLAAIPPERRALVTNHDALAYFADRYDLEIVGSVISSASTSAQASASDLEDLAALIEERKVPAIFAETTASDRLAEALADEVGHPVEVVELYTGSLGKPGSGAESYIGFMMINAERISAALS